MAANHFYLILKNPQGIFHYISYFNSHCMLDTACNKCSHKTFSSKGHSTIHINHKLTDVSDQSNVCLWLEGESGSGTDHLTGWSSQINHTGPGQTHRNWWPKIKRKLKKHSGLFWRFHAFAIQIICRNKQFWSQFWSQLRSHQTNFHIQFVNVGMWQRSFIRPFWENSPLIRGTITPRSKHLTCECF